MSWMKRYGLGCSLALRISLLLVAPMHVHDSHANLYSEKLRSRIESEYDASFLPASSNWSSPLPDLLYLDGMLCMNGKPPSPVGTDARRIRFTTENDRKIVNAVTNELLGMRCASKNCYYQPIERGSLNDPNDTMISGPEPVYGTFADGRLCITGEDPEKPNERARRPKRVQMSDEDRQKQMSQQATEDFGDFCKSGKCSFRFIRAGELWCGAHNASGTFKPMLILILNLLGTFVLQMLPHIPS
jgi:hypothetical protein